MRTPRISGLASRAAGGVVQRFVHTPPHADRASAALRGDHPAIAEARTLFPSTVVEADESPRLLVSGWNSAKIGRRIRKGPWAGLLVYTVTLEERATCPPACDLWRECYGNSMPMARRHRHGAEFERLMGDQLAGLLAMPKHRRGIAVRLHILGDFYSLEYAALWLGWLAAFPTLRVWGYTHHRADSPVGRAVLAGNRRFPDRWAFRTSVPPDAPQAAMQATTIWRHPDAPVVPEGLVCPASTDKTQACVTCGLCWEPDAADKRIVFVGHGMRHHTGKRMPPATLLARQIDHAGGAVVVARGMGMGRQTIERYRHTGVVPKRHAEALGALLDRLGRRASPAPS